MRVKVVRNGRIILDAEVVDLITVQDETVMVYTREGCVEISGLDSAGATFKQALNTEREEPDAGPNREPERPEG